MAKELPAILTEPPEVDKPHRNLQVGDVVIVKDDSAPRNLWKLAHVDQTYPDDDGLVSKVHIAVADDSLDNERRRTRAVAFLERPIQKLILLPPTIHTRTGEPPSRSHISDSVSLRESSRQGHLFSLGYFSKL